MANKTLHRIKSVACSNTSRPYAALAIFTLGHMMHHVYTLAIPPLLPIFKSMYRLSYFEVGFLSAAFFIGMTAQIATGFLSDRIGDRKKLVSSGLVLTAILVAALGLGTSYIALSAIALVA